MRANECFEATNYSIITFSCSLVRLVFQRREGEEEDGARLRDLHLISLNLHCKHVCFPGLELEKKQLDTVLEKHYCLIFYTLMRSRVLYCDSEFF